MKVKTVVAVVVAALIAELAWGHETPCNVGNATRCLEGVRDYLTRTDWWFGDAFLTNCPGDTGKNDYACMNPDTNHKTIITRILQRENFDVNKITQTLSIRYNVPAGSYLACGQIFSVPSVMLEKDIDHTHVIYLDTWILDHRPSVTWEPEPGAVYTLVAYDVDHLQLGGLWVNIAGGDSALGHELIPHMGPRPAFADRVTFHAYVLFKQSGVITENQYDVIKMNIRDYMMRNGAVYKLHNLLATINQIDDPMGVGLIGVRADPFGAEAARAKNLANNCPWLIAKKQPVLQQIADVHGLKDLGVDFSKLDVQLDMIYFSEEITYTSCCHNKTELSRVVSISPLSSELVMPFVLRSKPYIRLSTVNTLQTNYFLDKMFTLLMLDVTPATLEPSSTDTVLWGLQVDFHGNSLYTGVALKHYTPPLPPIDRGNNEISTYLFLVFQQNVTMADQQLSDYCSGDSYGGCMFQFKKFIQDHKLRLAGMNIMRTKPDLYSRMIMNQNYSLEMDKACAGVPKYSTPCPDPCAPTTDAPTTAAPTTQKPTTQAARETTTPNNSAVITTIDMPIITVSLLFCVWSKYLYA